MSHAVKNRIKQYICDKRSIVIIVEAEGVSKNSVYRIIDNILAFGTYIAPRVFKKGLSFKIFPTIRVKLRVFIESKSWTY